ncbi:MAG: hypothetical protein ACD_10C00239G0003 [uncultured bacterium]|nr:MAG: hypothetical protein ACD_10C00239G0003 [uncultured bacterium]
MPSATTARATPLRLACEKIATRSCCSLRSPWCCAAQASTVIAILPPFRAKDYHETITADLTLWRKAGQYKPWLDGSSIIKAFKDDIDEFWQTAFAQPEFSQHISLGVIPLWIHCTLDTTMDFNRQL